MHASSNRDSYVMFDAEIQAIGYLTLSKHLTIGVEYSEFEPA